MSCCGDSARQQRRLVASATASLAVSPHGTTRVELEFVGTGRLNVIGPYSGIQYTFPGPGAVLVVDSRDALSMLSVPGLRPSTRR
jgi:hypothetical protein